MSRWLITLLLFNTILFSVIFQRIVTADEDGDIDDEPENPPLGDESEPISEPELQIDKPRERLQFIPPDMTGASGKIYFLDYFESADVLSKVWLRSETKKEGLEENLAKYDGQWAVEVPDQSALEGDYALVLKSRARHHAISAPLTKPFEFNGKSVFIAQYSVKFEQGMECGGAYIKLLTQDSKLDLKKFYDKTPYTIMFGPDKCGVEHKLHFIFRHKNPKTGDFQEKHAKKPSASIDSYFVDRRSHLYTLVLTSDQHFQVYVDQSLVNSGSLLEDFEPPVNPPREIIDPNDVKPADWDEREKIEDTTATKPDDWDETQPELIEDLDAIKPEGWLDDEPALVDDPESTKPSDWDDSMDGTWEPRKVENPKCADAPGCGEWKRPMKKNPLYKGKWHSPLIENPSYKGKWAPRSISNPDFFEDNEPFQTMSPIGAIGLELWSMTDNVVFDDFIITDTKSTADRLAEQTWRVKQSEEGRVSTTGSGGFMGALHSILEVANEKPWVWGMLALVILLPLLLLCRSLFRSKPKSVPKKYASAKKTDEPQPDSPAAASSKSSSSSATKTTSAGSQSSANSKDNSGSGAAEAEGDGEESESDEDGEGDTGAEERDTQEKEKEKEGEARKRTRKD